VTGPARRTTVAALLRGAAAVGLVVAGLSPLAATPAAVASEDICVALVVDYGGLGPDVDSDCVTVPAGSSGEDVLRAEHTVGFRPFGPPGFVCTIDGWPREGCGMSTGEHYWAYFHRAPGSSDWTYSTSGASGYHPANRSTEGWVWLTRDDETPAGVPYSAICTATPTPKASATGSGTSGGKQHAGATKTAATPTVTTPAGTAAAQRDRTPHRAETTSAAARPSDSTTPAAATATTTPPSTGPSTPARRVAADPAGSDGPPYGLAAGAALVVGLGAAAAYRVRRTRDEP
jgi:hypothetical protein